MRTWDQDGGAAFPIPGAEIGTNPVEYGMSLRDYFAAQALAGYFANPSTPHRNAEDCAEYLYRVADAMLAERDK